MVYQVFNTPLRAFNPRRSLLAKVNKTETKESEGMRRVFISILVLAILTAYGSCKADPGISIAGTWESASGSVIVLSNNGSYTFTVPDEDSISGMYAILDNTITFDSNPYPYNTFDYAVTDTTLTLRPSSASDPVTQVYSRQ